VDTLVALHAVDPTRAGLASFGRPERFNARHLARILRLVADAGGAPPPSFAPLTAWLLGRTPPERGGVVVHHDYRIGNVVLAPDGLFRVAAVLDWELATLGDPLWDLAYLVASWPVPDTPPTPTQALGAALLEDGYPHRSEVVARYAARSGRDVAGLEWYLAAVHWKLGVLYEYQRRRAVEGTGDLYYADPGLVRAFLTAGHRTAGLDTPPAS
jgi:aminoglycoside phosphotransferase (APT) family kinase protein